MAKSKASRKNRSVMAVLGPLARRSKLQSLAVVLAFSAVGASYLAFSNAATGGEDLFSASCLTSHIANDDPIVFPNQPGAAHTHEFSGAWSTDAYTTPESLLASGTSCDPEEDTGAYWTPVLYVKGKRVPVSHSTPYYAKGRHKSNDLKAWPQGFRMIADIKNSTKEKSGHGGAGWLCGSKQRKWGYTNSLTGINWHCPYDSMEARIIFPDCWDGKNLDTVNSDGTAAKSLSGQAYPNDHRAHVTYTDTSGNCPASHPVATPRIDLKMTFQTAGLTDVAVKRPTHGYGDDNPTIEEPNPAHPNSKNYSKSEFPVPDPPRYPEGDKPSDFTVAGGGLNGLPVNNNYGVDTFHADFYNGWKQDRLEYLIDYCIVQKKAESNKRPCLNPENPATKLAKPNPNFPNATQPDGSHNPAPPPPNNPTPPPNNPPTPPKNPPTPPPTPPSPPIINPSSDKSAPSKPDKFTGKAESGSRVTLTWKASTDNKGGSGIKGYNIYVNGSAKPINATPITTSKGYIVTGLKSNTKYKFTIEAVDNAGNKSSKSNIHVRTQR